jgi:hypothetical protein
MGYWEAFLPIVDREFEFLESEFDFEKISDDLPFVRYKSRKYPIQISIWLDMHGKHELDLGIRNLQEIDTKTDTSVGIDALVKYRVADTIRKYRYPSYSKEVLEQAVAELGTLLKQYGRNILLGNVVELSRIKEAGIKESRMRWRTSSK